MFRPSCRPAEDIYNVLLLRSVSNACYACCPRQREQRKLQPRSTQSKLERARLTYPDRVRCVFPAGGFNFGVTVTTAAARMGLA